MRRAPSMAATAMASRGSNNNSSSSKRFPGHRLPTAPTCTSRCRNTWMWCPPTAPKACNRSWTASSSRLAACPIQPIRAHISPWVAHKPRTTSTRRRCLTPTHHTPNRQPPPFSSERRQGNPSHARRYWIHIDTRSIHFRVRPNWLSNQHVIMCAFIYFDFFHLTQTQLSTQNETKQEYHILIFSYLSVGWRREQGMLGDVSVVSSFCDV